VAGGGEPVDSDTIRVGHVGLVMRRLGSEQAEPFQIVDDGLPGAGDLLGPVGVLEPPRLPPIQRVRVKIIAVSALP
jgi:hypothetical protein